MWSSGEAIVARPAAFCSIPWFDSCHLGIAGVCLRLMQLRSSMFGCRGLSYLQASESMVQLMAKLQ